MGFFEPGPWRWFDPFEHLKTAELRDPAPEPDLVALDDPLHLGAEEQARAKLLASLWGNRADLGFRFGATSAGPGEAASAKIIVNQSAALWATLTPGASVVLVADNADLVLIEHLLVHRHVGSVSLHVKPYPYYVSDVTTADVVSRLRRLSATPGTAAATADLLHAAMGEGTVRLCTHEFCCAPCPITGCPPTSRRSSGRRQ